MTFTSWPSLITPSIAQLVERWTVVVHCQTSIGRWFKSGSREFFSWSIPTWKANFLSCLTRRDRYRFLDSLVVRISACHVEGPGSIPGRGEKFSLLTKSFVAPGEARTHNPGITLCTVYKYRALTDCATGAYWTKGTHARCGVRTHAILRL